MKIKVIFVIGILLLFAVVCGVSSTSISSYPTNEPFQEGSQDKKESIQEESQDSELNQEICQDEESKSFDDTRLQEILNGFIVRRKTLIQNYNALNDDDNSFYIGNIEYSIVKDVNSLVWIAQRGGCGQELGESWPYQTIDISESPLIQKINGYIRETDFYWDGTIPYAIWDESDLQSENVWIRLIFNPVIWPKGSVGLSHKDILVYTNPDNKEDAFLALQNPRVLTEWVIYTLPGYRMWLTKEIDILLRMTISQ